MVPGGFAPVVKQHVSMSPRMSMSPQTSMIPEVPLRDHTVVVGFGTKGRSAIRTACAAGLRKEQVVVIDPSAKAIDAARAEGYEGVVGDATRSDVLRRAEVQRAGRIVIATQRDDTAVLVALTARQLNPAAKIVAAVREEENAPLLRQSGADEVITSAGAAAGSSACPCSARPRARSWRTSSSRVTVSTLSNGPSPRPRWAVDRVRRTTSW